MKALVRCLLLAGSLDAADAFAATFAVTTTNVTGPGSLQQAIFDANTNAGTDTITFNIASGGRTISPTNALPALIEPVTIDGSTQPGFVSAPIIELNGASAGAATDGLRIFTSNSTIRSFVINRFSGDGIEIATNGNNAVEGCYLGLNLAGTSTAANSLNGVFITNSPNNVVGGIFSTQRNFISGNSLHGIHIQGATATNNQVLGNIIGLNVNDTISANGSDGIRLVAARNIIGGTNSGARNVISGNTSDGIEILGGTNAANQILGNYIGPDSAGALDRGNLANGIFVNNAGGTLIGGAAAGAGNLLSGNGDGIELNGVSATNNVVLGNLIGTTASGASALANSANGVLITTSSRSNVVGGVNVGEANTIAFNTGDGINVAAATANTNNTFRGNSIVANGGLGIDLGASGITANDSGDPDTGANQLQNFPVLSAVTNTPAELIIVGSLNSRPSTTYALDFYSNLSPDASASGEGQTWLGATNLTTAANSNVTFTILLPVTNLTGRHVTATATDPFGNTSEFATNTVAVSTVPGLVLVVVNTNDSGAGSLREAINQANAAITTGDTISFAIPGSGPHTIAPASALPAHTDPGTTIDGYTQTNSSANTLLNGNNAVLKIRLTGVNNPFILDGLKILADNTAVRGLCIVDFGDAIEVVTDGNNVIEGNFLGLEPDGVTPNPANLTLNNSPGNRVGGASPAARNVIVGNISISGVDAVGNEVQGNLLGTTASGTVHLSSGDISLSDAGGNLIGGVGAGAGNVVSDINFSGLNATNNQVFGNFIGTDPTGTLARGSGVSFTGGRRNFIGGINPGEGNIIAFGSGVRISAFTATNNAIRGNSIHDNSGLGIDLGSSAGVTANDTNDVDTGFNALQNFPVLTSATITSSNVTILGTLHSRSNSIFALDFYSNLAADPTGFGEGAQYLGSTNVTTDGSGNASFTATLAAVAVGDRISATATSTNNDTSEFSQTIQAAVQLASSTFTVVNTNDSGGGSLREAITQNNVTISTSNNLIRFAMAGAGPHVIRPLTPLPNVTQPATIDGYTQTNASGNTLANGFDAVFKIILDGSLAGAGADGLRLSGSNHVVRGLVISGFSGDGVELISGGGQFIEGNLIASNLANGVNISGAAGNTIGGIAAAQRNLISSNAMAGVQIISAASSNNIVQGNFVGTDATGSAARGNGQRGLFVAAANNLIGGTAAGAGNVISGNNVSGLEVSGLGGNTVQGNRVGTDAAGLAAVANGFDGIRLNSTAGNLIGGTTPGAGNLISGNLGFGVELLGVATVSNVLQVNFIGTDATGENPLPNAQGGVFITANASNNRIGGSGNTIAFNTGDGVAVVSGTGNSIRHNSIFENTELGIDLLNDGVTTNDVNDADSGPNNRQNFPILNAATANTNNTVITGSLNSAPNTPYELDFFCTPLADESGNGEGRTYLGSTNVTTDGSGNVNFTAVLPVVLTARQITATATSPGGDTSEFGPPVEAASTIPAMTFMVINNNDDGPGSLRYAISNANAAITVTNDIITFNIPGPEPHVIETRTPLPDIVDPVTIAGSAPSPGPRPAGGGGGFLIEIQRAAQTAVYDGLNVRGNNNIVRGVLVRNYRNGVNVFGNFNTIAGNTFGDNVDGMRVLGSFNTIGGKVVQDANVVSSNSSAGVFIEAGARGNAVQGNYIGTSRTGTAAEPNGTGVEVRGHDNTIGGIAPGAGNLISGNKFSGVLIVGSAATGNLVPGNKIGVDLNGTLPLPNGTGVRIEDAAGNTIGGADPFARNRIAANSGTGVVIQGAQASGNVVEGNDIGRSALPPVVLGNGVFGVHILNAPSNSIFANAISANAASGAVIQGAGAQANLVEANSIVVSGGHGVLMRVNATRNSIVNNTIFSNTGDGVNVDSGAQNAIRANRIGSSGQLGIDLSPVAGVTVNDGPGDPDGGANLEQNFPILSNACWNGSLMQITGILESTANTLFQVEFFQNQACDPSLHGEGEVFLGVAPVTTDDSGRAPINVSIPVAFLIATSVISATATDPFGNTSEFSPCLTNICSTVPPKTFLVRTNGGTGTNSFFWALTENNDSFTTNQNRIEFDLPKPPGTNEPSGTRILIRTNETLPPIRRPVIIDGCNKTNTGGGGGFFLMGAGGSPTNCDKVIIDGTLAGPGAIGLQIDPGGAGSEIWNLAIVGFPGDGIKIGGSNGVASDGNLVQDSCILSNAGAGISLNGSNNQLVANQIEFNQVGIVGFAGTGNRFDQNCISFNTALGIDLGGNGVTPNDPGDADAGPNNLQNFPALTGAFNDGMGNLRIVGGFQGSASSTISAQFFANASLDGSGFGEGASFVGQTQFNTDAQGNGSFDATFAASVPAGQFVTGTATDAANNTSEFSAGAVVQDGVPANLVLTGPLNSTVKVNAPFALVHLVANTGPLTATGLVFKLLTPLPIGAVDVSQGSSMISSGMVNCALGTLASGSTATVTVFARAPTPGSHTNCASVSAAQLDQNLANNSNMNVVTTFPVLDLVVFVTTPTNPPVGSSNVITITVTNKGPANAPAVFVQSARPPGAVIVGTSNPHGAANPIDDFVMFEIGPLAAGQTKTVNVTLRPDLLGLFRNAVEVFVPEATEATPADNLAIAEFYVPANAASADIEVIWQMSPATVVHGVPYSALARVINHGPAIATGVTVGVNLPVNSVLRSNNVSQGAATPTGSLLVWNVGTLTPGGPAAEVTLEAESYFTRPFNDRLILAARAIADALDPELTNNLSSVAVNVQPPALDLIRSNGNVVVSYPITAHDFQLQAGYDLTPPGDWAFVNPFLIGSNAQSYTYSFSPLAGPSNTTYFRLVSTGSVPAMLPAVAFYQYDQSLDGYRYPFSEWGAADVTFLGSTGIYYFNLAVGANWLAQNVPLVSVKGTGEVQTVRVHLPLGEFAKPKLTLSYKWGVTTNAQSGPPSASASDVVYPLETLQFSGHQDRPMTYIAPLPAVGGTVASNATANPTFPNREQGKGECTPAAILNSLEYLNARYNLNIATQHLTMDAIKEAIGWTPYGTISIPFISTWPQRKQAYMDANNIPIETIETTDPYAAMNALLGERDVEFDLNNHTLCLRAISDLGTNNFWVTLSDDLFQGKVGGARTFGARLELGWIYSTVYGKFSRGDTSRTFSEFVIERPK